eukprot:366196-Chlamydomonas_euryale.AAC.14
MTSTHEILSPEDCRMRHVERMEKHERSTAGELTDRRTEGGKDRRGKDVSKARGGCHAVCMTGCLKDRDHSAHLQDNWARRLQTAMHGLKSAGLLEAPMHPLSWCLVAGGHQYRNCTILDAAVRVPKRQAPLALNVSRMVQSASNSMPNQPSAP